MTSTQEQAAALAENRRAAIERVQDGLTCSVIDAGMVLGIGRALAYRSAHDGTLPVVKVGTRLRVSVPALLAMLDDPATAERAGA